MNDFEWNENKRRFNLEKHSIDFIDAIEVFNDPNRIEAESYRAGETRYQTIGIVNTWVFLVVYTTRNSKRRIISARTASKIERKAYHEAQKDEKQNELEESEITY